jgi:exosortase/archaeosortase family protein
VTDAPGDGAPRPRLLLRFGLLFPLIAGGTLLAVSYVPFLERARDGASEAVLATSAALFPLVGYDVRRDPAKPRVLRAADGHGVTIAQECDALPPLVLFLAAVLVSPVAGRKRLVFGLAGAAAIFLLNQVRVGHLLWLSQEDPDAFRTAHEAWWPAGLVLFAGGMFLVWARRNATRAP